MHPDQSPNAYPVAFEAWLPSRFDRVQLLLRLLVAIAIGTLHQSLAGLFGVLYLFLPITAAILLSRKQGAQYLADDSDWISSTLEWVLGLYAYLLFVTDRFPLGRRDRTARLYVYGAGHPTVGSALMRLFTSLPHALVLALLGMVTCVVSLVAAVFVLFTERYPESLHGFQREVVGWLARMLAYHASLVQVYPPFSFGESGAGGLAKQS